MPNEQPTPTTAQIRQLVYVSAATLLPSEDALFELLEQARDRNEKGEITGLLLYGEGSFIQVLEGPPAAVGEVFESIRRDARHERIRILIDQEIPQRAFPTWSMAFRAFSRDEIRETPEFSDFMVSGSALETLAEANRAITLLERFRALC